MKRLVLALSGALVLLSLPATARQPNDPTPIRPGYWESTNRVQFFVRSTSTERKCLREEDIEKFFSGPSNRHYRCEYPTRVVANGQARFDGVCTDKRGRKAYVTASGTYTPDSFRLNARIRTSIIGVPITPTGTMEARRIGDTCPPGAPRP